MKPAFDRLSRRQFLVGAGGTLLPLPLLPSLLPREARAAATAADSGERYFAHTTTWHGVFNDSMFGALLTQPPTLTGSSGGVAVRAGPIATSTKGTRVVISDCVQAEAAALSPRMLSRLTLINGLDFHTGVGHNRGMTLGGDGTSASVDQVLANSVSFYPVKPAAPAIVRNLVSVSRNSSGSVTTEQTAESNVKLFDRLFAAGGGTVPSDPMVVIDRVKEHADLVKADPACGTECRQRLGDYMDLLAGIATSVKSGGGSSFPRPTDDTQALEAAAGFYGQPAAQVRCEALWNDIVVAAFAAGISRVYVSGPNTYTFGDESEHAWHGDYAHAQDDPVKRAGMNAAVALQFEGVLLDLANKLDRVTTADGRTLFDKSLLAQSTELGSGGDPGHHHNRCIPVVMLGDAGGYFKAGQYLDYRDLTGFTWSSNPHWYSGLLYNQWLGMVLRAMGVPKAELDTTVWGYPNVRQPNGDHTDLIWNTAGQDLPWLKA